MQAPPTQIFPAPQADPCGAPSHEVGIWQVPLRHSLAGGAQSAAVMQTATHRFWAAVHRAGPQATSAGCEQLPWPSQDAAGLRVAPLQRASAQGVPALTALQVPTLPPRMQDMHGPWQLEAQHTPSVHTPEVQSVARAHAAPAPDRPSGAVAAPSGRAKLASV